MVQLAKTYFKQLRVPFKIYADLECILKGVQSSSKTNGSYTEKYQHLIPCSFAYKVVCVNDKFSKEVALYRGKNAAYRFIKAIFKEYNYCTEVIKNSLIKIFLCLQKKKKNFN